MKIIQRLVAGLCLLVLGMNSQAGVNISQFPLITSGGAADNLVLVPSVEWPTINSVTNLGDYSKTENYVGYFDSEKCYKYNYNATETERYFYPVRVTTNDMCVGAQQEWSGNYLNWASTQTIDAFRSALTGGYRVKDTTTETWLEKARHDGQGGTGLFPNRRLPAGTGSNAGLVTSQVGFVTGKSGSSSSVTITSITTLIANLKNKMRFTVNGTTASTSTITPYNPANTLDISKTYELSMRVKVCVSGLLETNCIKYGSNYKPEGVIQEYAGRLRYSAFGYLNHSDVARDGAVLRAKQKSVGPYLASMNSDESKADNSEKEWDATTGILIQNPDKADADNTNSNYGLSGSYKIVNSGVINYINKFGQLIDVSNKSYDPVSEMYYSALRYIRGQNNVPAYSNILSSTPQATKYQYMDAFPVITDWKDPYEASCQTSAFLGIGDVNTHRDKNLPGNATYLTEEPTKDSVVTGDTNLNVLNLTKKIGQLEGITRDIANTNDFSGRYNSAYLAGMAWYANTSDIRSDLAGKQTAATFWVDVLEGQTLQPMATNQYALAAKYGGFRVPEAFDPEKQTTALPEGWWHTNTDTLTPSSGNAFKRPDNYFTAGQSSKIVSSIRQVFARIVTRVNGSGAGLASNSTKLVTGSKVFQSVFFNKSWHGELKAFTVNTQTGQLNQQPDWLASEKLPLWSSRKIYVGNSLFLWSNLTTEQQTALGSADIVNYLRGDATNEQRNGGMLRDRFITPLGDIVHSQPVLVGKPDAKLYAGKIFSGASTYANFANSKAQRRPILYVGGNDGMLHGFDAQTGVESYAFVPNVSIQGGMKSLAAPDYTHKFFVNGELTVSDVYLDNTWKTILIGTMGVGGKGVFALDVTDPDDVKFLWEKNDTDIPALGNNLGKPIIVQTADGVWKVVLGNGPNSTGDQAQLIMIELATGTATAINTNVGGNNGLSGVTAWSKFANGIAETFFAGDLNGNIWEIPVNGSPKKLFTAINDDNEPQPITMAPLAGIDPSTGKFWLFFGTGKYLSQLDLGETSQQSWYGIKPKASGTVDRDNMQARSMEIEQDNGEIAVRVSDKGTAAELVDKDGWYFDLPATGERMVVPNVFQGDVLIGTVRIPDASDICKPTGRGFIIALNPFTGGRLNRIFFDVNVDGKFNEDDNVTLNGDSTIVSGIGFDSSPNSPIFIGNVMQVVKDDGTITSILTQGLDAKVGRMSWNEVVNQ